MTAFVYFTLGLVLGGLGVTWLFCASVIGKGK